MGAQARAWLPACTPSGQWDTPLIASSPEHISAPAVFIISLWDDQCAQEEAADVLRSEEILVKVLVLLQTCCTGVCQQSLAEKWTVVQMCSQTYLQSLGLVLVRADVIVMAFSEMESMAMSGVAKQ